MLSSVKNQTSCTSVDTVNNRAQALALLDAGLSVKDVAKQLCKSERWVTKWRRRREQKKTAHRPTEIGPTVENSRRC